MDQELLALASAPPDKPRRQQQEQQQPEEEEGKEDGSKTAGGGAKAGIDLAGADDEAAAFAERMRQQVRRGLCGAVVFWGGVRCG